MFILVFSMDFIASFVIGLVFTFIATYKKGRMNIFIQSMFEGGAVVMPAVALMFGIGMLLVAIMGPGIAVDAYPDGWPVIRILKPLMINIVPSDPFEYVLYFTLAAPLALYRGPFNVWGMGYGLAGVFLASGLNPGAVMGSASRRGTYPGDQRSDQHAECLACQRDEDRCAEDIVEHDPVYMDPRVHRPYVFRADVHVKTFLLSEDIFATDYTD
jgi:hypothetical protein